MVTLTLTASIRQTERDVMLWSEWGEQLEMTQYSRVDLPTDTESPWPLQHPQPAGQTQHTHIEQKKLGVHKYTFLVSNVVPACVSDSGLKTQLWKLNQILEGKELLISLKARLCYLILFRLLCMFTYASCCNLQSRPLDIKQLYECL